MGKPGYAGCVMARKKFQAVLERLGNELRWTIVTVPFDPATAWKERNRLRVRGTIRSTGAGSPGARSLGDGSPKEGGGFAFRTSLFRMKEGTCFLLVNKAMQKRARVTFGAMVEVELEPDLEKRVPETPAELEKLLRTDRTLRKWHDALNPSSRKWIADWVAQPKGADSRVKRAEQIAERMLLTMEGERVTPPILEAAFQRLPKAREGWKAMTALQRRQHLLGIYGYLSPESRQKRVQKTIEEALRICERSSARRSKQP